MDDALQRPDFSAREQPALAAALAAVSALHCRTADGDNCGGTTSDPVCRECGTAWPCRTMTTISSRLR